MGNPSWTPGHFVWRELMTADVDAAKAFYGELFGWSFEDADMGDVDMTYTLIRHGGTEIGGMMVTQGEPPPCWASYVSVPNVDEAAAAATSAGGSVAVAPTDVPGVGRFAVLGDAAGAYFSVCRWTGGDPEPSTPTEGTFCWETLSTPDVDGAFAFYAKVCGWGATPGPGGAKVFAMGETAVADPQPLHGEAPPHWMTYVIVPGGVAAGRDRAAKHGAQVLVPEIDVPEVGKFAIIADPEGAVIGLFEATAG